MNNLIKNEIKMYFVRDHIENTFPPAFEIFLVNTSKANIYKNIKVVSSANYSSEDRVDKTDTVEKELSDLIPLNSVSVDISDVYELDDIISYNILFKDGQEITHEIKCHIKGSPTGELQNVFGTELNGVEIEYTLVR